jgi:hypothetical protein
MKNAINANKERQDYYNQLKSGITGGKNNSNQGGLEIANGTGWVAPSNYSANVPDQQQQNAWTNAFNSIKSFGEPSTDNP